MFSHRRGGHRSRRDQLNLGFSPTKLGGTTCVLWLRADAGITLATGVSQWNDMSGGGANATQSTGTLQPTYNASDSSYGHQPTMSYLGSSAQYLIGTLTLIQPYTVIIVGENDAAASGGFFGGSGTAGGVVYSTAGQLIQLYSGSVLTGTASIAGPCAIAAIFNGGNSAAYVNSSTTANVTGSAGTTAFGSTYGLGSNNGAPASLTGKIAEVMVFNNALSSAQISQVFKYIASRYKLTGIS